MQAIAQPVVEAARVAVQAMAVVRTDSNDMMQNEVPQIGGPIMQQSTFNWETEDK